MSNSNVMKGTVKWFNEARVLVLFSQNQVQMFLLTLAKSLALASKLLLKVNPLNSVLHKVKKAQML